MIIFAAISCALRLMTMVTSSAVAPTHLLVTRVGPCYETGEAAVSISEMTLTRKQYDSSLSGKLNISQDIDNGWTIRATMQKCHDIRNLDTCDYFRSFAVVSAGCVTDAELEEEELYTMFFHYVQPRLQCPLQAGSYKITSYPFFTEDSDLTVAEAKISTSIFGYTYRLEGFDAEDTKLLCADAYLQLLYVRDHDWVGGKKIGVEAGATASPQPEREGDSKQEDEYTINMSEE